MAEPEFKFGGAKLKDSIKNAINLKILISINKKNKTILLSAKGIKVNGSK